MENPLRKPDEFGQGPWYGRDEEISRALERAEGDRVIQRLWAKDPGLWTRDPGHRAVIDASLGWLDLPRTMAPRVQELEEFARGIWRDGFRRVLLLGMGGSSLAPEVFRGAFPRKAGALELRVLDTTDPEALASAERASDTGKTLFLVSSKSGTTVEPLRLFDFFYEKARRSMGAEAGAGFIAITDPGSPLETLAGERGFRRTFLNPADVGGRFSALSYFGLVPAALLGVDLARLLERARAAREACSERSPHRENPGLRLGLSLFALSRAGRDKATLLVSPKIPGLGSWLEQLVAESTGKEGRGLVPITEEPPLEPGAYGPDRFFVRIAVAGEQDRPLDAFARRLADHGHPVVSRFLSDPLDLGGEMYVWEVATAVLGAAFGVDAFDQPNVEEAKVRTRSLLERLSGGGTLPAPEGRPVAAVGSASLSRAAQGEPGEPGEQALARLLGGLRSGDYVGLLAYLSCWGPYDDALGALRKTLLHATGAATQFGYGPRYLHSTGQLHKGGPDNGVFMLLLRDGGPDLPIPGSRYTFGQLLAAQADGDFQALDASGRRAVLIRLRGEPRTALERLSRVVAGSLRPPPALGRG